MPLRATDQERRVLGSLCGALLGIACGQPSKPQPTSGIQPPGGPAPAYCTELALQQLALDEPTSLGVSARELLEQFQPPEPKPLFWVPYGDLLTARYVPGVGETRLTLVLRAREAEPVLQHLFASESGQPSPYCYDRTLEIPVLIAVQTADGALDEQIDATLVFFSRHTAAFSVFLPANEIAGRFGLTPTGDLASATFLGLSLGASLWPGGSRGVIRPQFSNHPIYLPPPGETTTSNDLTPTVPSQWSALAVWPHREQCLGTVLAADEPLPGWSPGAAIRELNSHATGSLLTAEAPVPIRFTLEASDLLCVEWGEWRSEDFRLQVPGRLRADTGAPASSLQHLDTVASFALAGHLDASGIQSLHWEQANGFEPGQSPADFAQTTGVDLPATADPAQQFVWSWQGTSTRGASADWTTTGSFTIRNAREKEGKICQAMFMPPKGTPPPAPICSSTFSYSELGSTALSADFVQ